MAYFDCYFRDCDVGLDIEAVLKSTSDSTFDNCNVSVFQRKSGYHGGAWASSGCNDNVWRGAFNGSRQYAMISDTAQGGTIAAHCESSGVNDTGHGGVSDTDRGGFKFINPEGSINFQGGSFEDGGGVSGAHEGKGMIYVLTDADNAGINWTLSLHGTYFKRTGGGPKSILYIDNDASAGRGHIAWNGAHLENNDAYTPDASNPTFNLTATGQNLSVSMVGGEVDGGNTEFSFNGDVAYSVVGIPMITPGGLWENFHLPVGGCAGPIVLGQSNVAASHTGGTTETTLASVTAPANAMGTNGRIEIEAVWSATNSANNKTTKIKFGSTTFGSNVLTTSPAIRESRMIGNRNSVASQIGGPVGGTAGWNLGGSNVTATVDTTDDVTLALTGTLANSGDTVTLEAYRALLYYAP
jgi:hypothetical protein